MNNRYIIIQAEKNRKQHFGNKINMSSFKTKSSVRPPQPTKPTNLNLKLNRFVYTKYRAMLGSYNDKANEIIQSLPTKKSILQQMDRRFSIGTNKKTPS